MQTCCKYLTPFPRGRSTHCSQTSSLHTALSGAQGPRRELLSTHVSPCKFPERLAKNHFGAGKVSRRGQTCIFRKGILDLFGLKQVVICGRKEIQTDQQTIIPRAPLNNLAPVPGGPRTPPHWTSPAQLVGEIFSGPFGCRKIFSGASGAGPFRAIFLRRQPKLRAGRRKGEGVRGHEPETSRHGD